MSAEDKRRQIKTSELFYDDYSDKAVEGDDPTKRKADSKRFSRWESYEIVDMINSIKWENDPSLNNLLTIEWMLHDELPSTTQGREKVKA